MVKTPKRGPSKKNGSSRPRRIPPLKRPDHQIDESRKRDGVLDTIPAPKPKDKKR